MHRTRLGAIAPITLALALAACGSSSSTSSSASPQSAGQSTTTTSTSSSASGRYGQTTAAAGGSAAAALITTKHDKKLGTILAYGPKKLTVYLFEADKGKSSSCSGSCAAAWPPVTGKPTAAGGAMSPDLGTITRPDGSTQVTYNGHPLYLFIRDQDDGDAYGQGVKVFGAGWYTLSASGNKVDLS